MEQTHTISKLLVQLQASSAGSAFEMQKALSNYCRELLPPLLSGWLDDCAGNDELLIINKPEIDLGACSWNQLERELGERVIAALNKKYGNLQQPGFAGAVAVAEIERKPLRVGYFESWLYFLERGFLPPTASIKDKIAWENAVLETIATESEAAEQCRNLLLKYPSALQRLILQFSPAFLQSWAGSFYGAEARNVFQLAEEWVAITNDRSFRVLVAEKINIHLPGALTGIQHNDLLTLSVRALLSPKQKDIMVTMLEALISASLPVPAQSSWKYAVKQVLPEYGVRLPALQEAVEKAVWPSTTSEKVPQEPGKDTYKFHQTEPPAIIEEATKAVPGERPELSQGKDLLGENNIPKNDHSLDISFTNPLTSQENESVEVRDKYDDIMNEMGEGAGVGVHQGENEKVIKVVDRKEQSTSSPNYDEPSIKPGHKTGPVIITGEQGQSITSEGDKNDPPMISKKKDSKFQETDAQLSIEERFRLFKNEIDNPSARPILKKTGEAMVVQDGTTVYTDNSGLVLLHPFLHAFFESIGLIQDKQFKNDPCRDKAVQLLAFLAHGEMGMQDYELVLPKLLCGIAPGQPVDRFIVLTAEEKDAATELLLAILQHWKALANTSPNGLRANFLLREGKLEFKNDQWQLLVTQQAYDVLLNQLPWGYGMIKLPWMPWLLTTVWV